MPTTLEQYLFDLRGYICLPQAIDKTHLSELNDLRTHTWIWNQDIGGVGFIVTPDGTKPIICTIYLKWDLLLKD